MRNTALGLLLAAFSGAAAAGDLIESRDDYASSDYAAQAYYRVDFGGTRQQVQSVGLRLDNRAAQSHGAPAMFQANFGSQGLDRLALNGVDLHGAMVAAGEGEGTGFFGSLSLSQIIALGATVLIAADVAADASDGNNDASPNGTGSGP